MTSLTHTNKYQSTEHGQSYGTEYASKCAQCTSTAFRILHAEFNISITRLWRHRTSTVPAGAKERAKRAKHIWSASITRRRNGCSLLICVDAHREVASSCWSTAHTHTRMRKQSKIDNDAGFVSPQLRQITGITWSVGGFKAFRFFCLLSFCSRYLVSGSTRHFSLALALRRSIRCACYFCLLGQRNRVELSPQKPPKGSG